MKKEALWFEFYGKLEWISKKEYLKGPYRYVGLAEADDGGIYDIVRNTKTDQEYYTEV